MIKLFTKFLEAYWQFKVRNNEILVDGGRRSGENGRNLKASPKSANFKHKPRKGTPTWVPFWNWAEDILDKILVVVDEDERGEELMKRGIAMWRGMLGWEERRGRMGVLILILTPHDIIPWTLITKHPMPWNTNNLIVLTTPYQSAVHHYAALLFQPHFWLRQSLPWLVNNSK